MTDTIIVTRCGDCWYYQHADKVLTEICWNLNSVSQPDYVRLNGPDHMPVNCPLLQTPVTYRAERKS